MIERSDFDRDSGQGFHPIERDVTGGQHRFEIGPVGDASHDPDQALRRFRGDVQGGSRPLRHRPAAVGGGNLCLIEDRQMVQLRGEDLRLQPFETEQLRLVMIDGPSPCHTSNIRSACDRFKRFNRKLETLIQSPEASNAKRPDC